MNPNPVDNPEYREALRRVQDQVSRQSKAWNTPTDTQRLDWLEKNLSFAYNNWASHTPIRDWIDAVHPPTPPTSTPVRQHMIIQARTIHNLDEIINPCLAQGATLSGGPFVVPCGWIAQAILHTPVEEEK
jgi:hypothetical protein